MYHLQPGTTPSLARSDLDGSHKNRPQRNVDEIHTKTRLVGRNKTNTMIQFSFFKEALTVSTDKAQLIKLGNPENPTKVWLPFSQITMEPDPEREEMMLITLPEWLFIRNSVLADFVNYYKLETV